VQPGPRVRPRLLHKGTAVREVVPAPNANVALDSLVIFIILKSCERPHSLSPRTHSGPPHEHPRTSSEPPRTYTTAPPYPHPHAAPHKTPATPRDTDADMVELPHAPRPRPHLDDGLGEGTRRGARGRQVCGGEVEGRCCRGAGSRVLIRFRGARFTFSYVSPCCNTLQKWNTNQCANVAEHTTIKQTG